MQITTEGTNVYSSDHGVHLNSRDELVDHVPAGKLFTDDDGKVLVRCTLGECEYRTKSGSRKQALQFHKQHLSAKH